MKGYSFGVDALYIYASDLFSAFNSFDDKESSNVWIFESVVYSKYQPRAVALSQGWFLSPGNIYQFLKTVLVVITWGLVWLASIGQRPGMLLNILQFRGWPPTHTPSKKRIIWSDMLIGPILKNSDLKYKPRTSIECSFFKQLMRKNMGETKMSAALHGVQNSSGPDHFRCLLFTNDNQFVYFQKFRDFMGAYY